MRRSNTWLPLLVLFVGCLVLTAQARTPINVAYQLLDLGLLEPTSDGEGDALPLPQVTPGQPTPTGTETSDRNSQGDIVGWVYGDAQRGIWQRATKWAAGRAYTLGPDSGSSAAFAINDLGDVIGWAEFQGPSFRTPERAALWPAGTGTLVDLGTLPTAAARSVARDINNARQIVGTAYGDDGTRRGFRWEQGAMTELQPLEGDTDSEAFAINERGDILGTSYQHRCGPCLPRAVVWVGGTATDLNAGVAANSGWHLMEATAFDDGGNIVGRGKVAGQPRYFLLTGR